jgi:phytoene synthase
MGPPPIHLEEPYRSRAAPPGTARYWSWLFAAPESRDPLIGMYALSAEWRALINPSTEREAAAIKLGWWREEIARLAGGAPLHPITRFVAALPRAGTVDFSALNRPLDAAARHLSGVPLERGDELEPHGAALWGIPLETAALLARNFEDGSESAVRRATDALGAAQYLEDALVDYRRDALRGRVIFPVDELLAAGVEDADLIADAAPPALASYLEAQRARAARLFRSVADGLAEPQCAPLRHLLILAALGVKHSSGGARSTGTFRLSDLYQAWSTARRAARRAPKR